MLFYIYMGFKSFKKIEWDTAITFLNGMTLVRTLGGLALGICMAVRSLSPMLVFIFACILAATDGEGFVYNLTKRFPRLQKALRIIPSKIGRTFDPIADKIFAISVLGGGLIGGIIPMAHGAILITEVATAIATVAGKDAGKDIQVSRVGTLGMIARCFTIGIDLAAANLDGIHHALTYAAHACAVAAVALGAASCYKIFLQSFGKTAGNHAA